MITMVLFFSSFLLTFISFPLYSTEEVLSLKELCIKSLEIQSKPLKKKRLSKFIENLNVKAKPSVLPCLVDSVYSSLLKEQVDWFLNNYDYPYLLINIHSLVSVMDDVTKLKCILPMLIQHSCRIPTFDDNESYGIYKCVRLPINRSEKLDEYQENNTIFRSLIEVLPLSSYRSFLEKLVQAREGYCTTVAPYLKLSGPITDFDQLREWSKKLDEVNEACAYRVNPYVVAIEAGCPQAVEMIWAAGIPWKKKYAINGKKLFLHEFFAQAQSWYSSFPLQQEALRRFLDKVNEPEANHVAKRQRS